MSQMQDFVVTVNRQRHAVRAHPDTPLLWVLRETLKLTGTKYGCGTGHCGACTVHIDGEAAFACGHPVQSLAGRNITTIEGLAEHADHPLQRAWITEQVPQCGYCQSGQIMRAATLLKQNATPSREAIVEHMKPVLCRCGSYRRIVAAIQRAAKGA